MNRPHTLINQGLLIFPVPDLFHRLTAAYVKVSFLGILELDQNADFLFFDFYADKNSSISALHSPAPFTQFDISMAMVMGPTPPGTGVIAEVFGATLSKSTSPQSFPSAFL